MDTFCILIEIWDMWVSAFTKTDRTIHLGPVYFTLCNFYLNVKDNELE